MFSLATAAEYILGIITENEEVKKFPKEFIRESVKWVKSWFLTPEDPRNTAKLQDPNKSIEVKKDIIDDKLAELQSNAVFMKELETKMQQYAAEKRKLLNVIDDSDIDVKGNFRQGNTGGAVQSDADEKNVIKRSKIKVGGDFRQGDDIQQGHTIVNNHYHGVSPSSSRATPPQYSSIKAELKTLLTKGKTDEVIERLLDITEKTDKDAHNTVSLLSGQINRLNNQENNGIIGFSDATTQRNRLSHSLMNVIDGLD